MDDNINLMDMETPYFLVKAGDAAFRLVYFIDGEPAEEWKEYE